MIKHLRDEERADSDVPLRTGSELFGALWILPRYPGVCVVTHRSCNQRRNGYALHSGDDGGDEDEDAPDGVMKELLKQTENCTHVNMEENSFQRPERRSEEDQTVGRKLQNSC